MYRINYEKRNFMSWIKKNWWVIAAVLVYLYWDKIKAMLGKTTITEQPAIEPTKEETPEEQL